MQSRSSQINSEKVFAADSFLMQEPDLRDAIEIIQDRLYWVALHETPEDSLKSHYFCIDGEFVYEPLIADFGPLKLSHTYRYCELLDKKLHDPALAGKRIVHYCSHDPKVRANAAYLIAAYQVIVNLKTAEQAYEPFCGIYPPFLPFRDATRQAFCTFHLTILDCLSGLQRAVDLGWFEFKSFDVESYEITEKLEHPDMNWIFPGKLLAFATPKATEANERGMPYDTPEDYVPFFRRAKIKLVIRLNEKEYDRHRFVDHGIRHVDLQFADGSCPPQSIVSEFLQIVENEPGAVAIHCKAGLGRTGTLIGLYCMKHCMFPARGFIAWNRICRPGSISGPQQQFLVDMQHDMFQAGAAYKLACQHKEFPECTQATSLQDHQRLSQVQTMDDEGLEDTRLEEAVEDVLEKKRCQFQKVLMEALGKYEKALQVMSIQDQSIQDQCLREVEKDRDAYESCKRFLQDITVRARSDTVEKMPFGLSQGTSVQETRNRKRKADDLVAAETFTL